MELTDDYISFIRDNEKADTSRLRLMTCGKKMCFDINDAIMQIESRQATAKKLPVFCSNLFSLFPHRLSAEQSTSEIIARYHAELLPDNTHCLLDMTAGLGIDSMAFSEKCEDVTAIERDTHTAEILRHNAAIHEKKNINVINADSVEYLLSNERKWDVIYVDPARRSKSGGRTYDFSDCTPDIISILKILYSRCGKLIIKASPMLDVTRTLKMIPATDEIQVISLKGECKELLISVSLNSKNQDVKCRAVNINAEGEIEDFTFSYRDHSNTKNVNEIRSVNELDTMKWLYEPNASLMKFAPWSILSSVFPALLKLHPNTHLFVSDSLIPDFPGRIFEIKDYGTLRSEVSNALKGEKRCVAIRNFPLSAQSLAKRLKVRNGGDDEFVFGVTINPDAHFIITATRYKQKEARKLSPS